MLKKKLFITGLAILISIVGFMLYGQAQNQTTHDLSAFVSLNYYDAVDKEMKSNPELRGLIHKAIPKDSGPDVEALLPKFDGMLSEVFLSNCAAGSYARAGRIKDAERVATSGLATAEKIIKAYPNARFISGLHRAAAEMISLHLSTKKDAAKVNATNAALEHLDSALRLDPDGKSSKMYIGTMQMKGALLATLGEEAKCLQVYDELLKIADSQTRLSTEYSRVQALIVLGKKAEAITELNRIIKDNPSTSWVVKFARKHLDELQKDEKQEIPGK